MAIEIVGKPEDVKKYREMLHARGQYTKWYLGELSSRTGVEIKKPEDFRVFTGSIVPISKAINEKGETIVKEASSYNEEEKLLIRGIANANIVDRVDERLEPAGIDVRNFMKNRVLLSDHMYMNQAVIGRVEELRVEDDGVHFDAYIGDPKAAPLTALQRDIRSLVAQKLIQTVSVGFIPHKIRAPEFDQEGKLVNPAVIEKWELLELSVVAVPANPAATFEMRSGISLNDNNPSENQMLTKNQQTVDNNKDQAKESKGNDMDEKTAQELVDSVKSMVTLLGSLSSTMERSINLNETILGHLEAKGKKPKEEEMPCEEEGCNKPKPKEEKEDEKSFDAKSAVEDIRKEMDEIKAQLSQISEILKVLTE